MEVMLSSNNRERPQVTNSDPSPPHCLLLGHTNLFRVLRSNLGDTCSVRTIHGANVDQLRTWVSEKLDTTPTECEICCDVDDILEELPSENILDNLASVTSDFKEKNCDM